jgi:hypothetical protein
MHILYVFIYNIKILFIMFKIKNKKQSFLDFIFFINRVTQSISEINNENFLNSAIGLPFNVFYILFYHNIL